MRVLTVDCRLIVACAKAYGSCVAAKVPDIERDMCVKEFEALKSCMQNMYPPLRFNVPGSSGLFYDDGNKFLLSPTADQVFSWKVGPFDPLSDPNTDSISEGPIIAIRYSLDTKVIAIQRSNHEIQFWDRETGGTFSHKCKPESESILGFFWTDSQQCDIVLVKTSGLDLYTYNSESKSLQLVQTKKLNVSWYVYTHESRLVLLASGMQCKTFHGFQISAADIVRLPRFEMVMAKSEANSKPVLASEDVFIVTVYGRIYCLQVDRVAMLLHSYRLYRDAVIQQQEKQIETETHIKKWETSTKFLKERTNISELKHMLRKILNEEVDSHASQQDKNNMEGSGSEFSEAKASSWARKVELPSFDRSIEGGPDLKGSSFECDSDPLQFLKLENRSKEEPHPGGEETKNDEAKLAREKKIEKVMEEEVDPSIKREKHKENGVTNVGCEDDFLDNPITDLIKKEVEYGDSTKPHCFQDSDFHKKIVMVKQKSFMKVVGTTMVLESWNVNLLGEPLALNFVASMADSLAMELRQKECIEPGSLPIYSSRIAVSVVDNVLLIHQVDAKVVILYDLFADSRAPISAPLPLLLRGFPRSSTLSQSSGRESESSDGNVLSNHEAVTYANTWTFLVPDLVCDVANKLLWKFNLDLEAISASSSEVPSILEFLQRRKLEANKAKQLCLGITRTLILEHRPVPVVAKAVNVLVTSYSHSIKTGSYLKGLKPENTSTSVVQNTGAEVSATETNVIGKSIVHESTRRVDSGSLNKASTVSSLDYEDESQSANLKHSSKEAQVEDEVNNEISLSKGAHSAYVMQSSLQSGQEESQLTSAAISPDEMYSFVFSPVDEEMVGDPSYLVAIIIEFLHSANSEKIRILPNVYVLIIQLLARNEHYAELGLFVLNKILEPSKEVALQLLESGRQNAQTRKLGLDMLRQLGLHHDYVLLLVQDGYYLEALRYARKYTVDTIRPSLFLEAAFVSNDSQHLAAVLRFFTDFLPSFKNTFDHNRYCRILNEMNSSTNV
ncbi:Regulator of MON1-CCZ1 complex [Glycine soja]